MLQSKKPYGEEQYGNEEQNLDSSVAPHTTIIFHDTQNTAMEAVEATYSGYGNLETETEDAGTAFDYEFYRDDTNPSPEPAYASKSHRIFVNLNVVKKVTCKRLQVKEDIVCLTGLAETSFTAPLFIGIATGALCCPDYVFDQYFDKKCEIPNYKILNIDETMDFAKTNRHLPTIKTNRSNIEEKQLNINELVLNLWETVETQAIHIKELNDRIKVLEEKVNS